MTTHDLFQETYTALSSNKSRSFLTILGIVIGISSVIAMISIGQGAQGAIQANIQSLGSNLVQVLPGAQRGVGTQISTGRGSARSITLDDAEAIALEITSIEAVAPEVSGRYQITSKGTNTNTSVVGTTAEYPQVRNVEIDLGTFISDQQNKSSAKVAVLGPTTRDDLFGEGTDPTGQFIRVKGVQFKIVGVTRSKGGTGFGNQDDMVFVPLTTAQRFLSGDEYLSNISIQAQNAEVMTGVQQAVTALLLDRHHISEPESADFTILNQSDIVSAASSVTETFTILLAAVAGISLVVGGIGIMNMMLTTVTERTREIGLRKAIGATRNDINTQFLVESVTLTFIGGLIGVFLGCGISFGIRSLDILQTKVSISSILLAFGVSAVIGIVFGYYPARRAAGLHPIDALRYE